MVCLSPRGPLEPRAHCRDARWSRVLQGSLAGAVLLAACGGGGAGTDAPDFAALQIVTQPPATVQTRTTLTPAPAVQLVDGQGQPFAQAGVTITVTLQGGGALSGTTQVSTDGNGLATFSGLSIAGLVGNRTLRFSASGVPAVTSNPIALTAGPAALITINAGNNQQALPSAAVAINPSVKVSDLDNNGVSGIQVDFAVTGGGGSITGATQTTNASGIATVGSWTLGSNPGTNTLSATATGIGSVSFTAIAGTFFQITLQFLTTPTSAQLAAFQQAQTRWQNVIVGDLNDVPFNANTTSNCGNQNINQTIDDVLILVDLVAIDGPGGILGSAGPCFIRTSNSLTILGYMRFDTADLSALESNGTLNAVILHEMGHVLGYGTLWSQPAFNLLSGAGGADPIFTGTQALAAFDNSNGGTAYLGNKIPVENTGSQGTRDSHWRESVFSNELMTGFLGPGTVNPMSLTTIMSMADLGYQVDANAADPFVIPSAPSPLIAGQSVTRIHLGNDILPITPRRVDETGRVLP